MSKFFPDGGHRFDAIRGYTSLNGNGEPVWDVERRGGKTVFTHRKTGKKQIWASQPTESVIKIKEGG